MKSQRLINITGSLWLLVLFSQATVNAQWVTNGPYVADIRAFAVSGSTIFAGTDGGGVFLSTNNGTSWTEVDSGLTGNGLDVQSLAVSGSTIFAGTYGRRCLSFHQ